MSDSKPILGVEVFPLRIIADERGALLHAVRKGAPAFTALEEVYFSEVKPGVIKGWKKHLRMEQRFTVPVGRMHLVVFDDREGSPSRGKVAEFVLGRPDHYQLLVLPPQVWYAFRCISEGAALMVNCANLLHDPAESEARAQNDPSMPCLDLLKC